MIVVWSHIMRIRWIPFWRTTSRASFWSGPTRFQNSLVDLHWVCHSDGGGAWQGFCWGAEQREQPRSNDWDQVLGRKGEETQVGKLIWFLFLHFFIVFLQCTNLESLFEQMKADTTRKMASILNVTDSAYYPCFRWSENTACYSSHGRWH